jgi:hypothetical protein
LELANHWGSSLLAVAGWLGNYGITNAGWVGNYGITKNFGWIEVEFQEDVPPDAGLALWARAQSPQQSSSGHFKVGIDVALGKLIVEQDCNSIIAKDSYCGSLLPECVANLGCGADGKCKSAPLECSPQAPVEIGVCAGMSACESLSAHHIIGWAAGEAGQSFMVPLRAARSSWEVPAPAALQFNLHWPTDSVELVELGDYWEPEWSPEAFYMSTQSLGINSTGHSTSVYPALPHSRGFGAVMLAHFSSPSTPITSAVFSEPLAADGELLAPPLESEFLYATFRILQPIALDSPLPIALSHPLGSDAEANSIGAKLFHGVIALDGEVYSGE